MERTLRNVHNKSWCCATSASSRRLRRKAIGQYETLATDDEFPSFELASSLKTTHEEVLRAPSITWSTTQNRKTGGDERVTELFLVLRFIHPPGLPDRAAAQGVWFISPGEILDYFGKRATAQFRARCRRPAKTDQSAAPSYLLAAENCACLGVRRAQRTVKT